MQLRWEPAYGPAFIAGLVQIVAIFVVGATIWTNLQRDVQAANTAIKLTNENLQEIKQLTTDTNINMVRHESRIVRTETAIEYIVPSLKRIEDGLTTLNNRR